MPFRPRVLSLDHLRLSRLIALSGQHLDVEAKTELMREVDEAETRLLVGIGQIFRRVTLERTGGEDRKADRICDSLEDGPSRSCAGEGDRLAAGGECERLFLFSVANDVDWCWGRGMVRWLSELEKLIPLFMLLQRLDGAGAEETGVNAWDVGEYVTDEAIELVRVGMRSGAVGAAVVVNEELFSFSLIS